MSHRVFISHPISQEAKGELTRIQNALKSQNKNARLTWSRPAGFHVTLAFLGEIEDQQIETVKNVLAEVAFNKKVFSYWLNKINAFPNIARPKVVIVTAEEEGARGLSLQKELVEALGRQKLFGDEKPWHPHVTLGRNKNGERLNGLTSCKVEKIVWTVDRIELLESKLTPNGPEYAVLGKYELIS